MVTEILFDKSQTLKTNLKTINTSITHSRKIVHLYTCTPYNNENKQTMTTWDKTDETHRLDTEQNKVTTKTHFV